VSGQELTGDEILAQARGLVKAGVFSLVLELVPADLATRITSEIPVPTIGIGAGNGTDAQVLVWSDLMGLTPNAPKLASLSKLTGKDCFRRG
jgi:3-methyl-2-oxobutanoate hydroxymethyltransferase